MNEFKNALNDWFQLPEARSYVCANPITLIEECEFVEKYTSPKGNEVHSFYCDYEKMMFYVVKKDNVFKVTLLPPDQTWYFGKTSDIDCCGGDVWIADNPDANLYDEGPIGYLLALEGVLPEGFEDNESSESQFEYDGAYRKARKILLDAGLIESRIKGE